MLRKVLITACTLMLTAVLYIIVCSFLVPAGIDKKQIVINYNGESVKGEFDGDLIDGKADGEGVFIGTSDEGKLVFFSTFEDGRMDGETRITLPDGSELSGDMRAGFWHGEVLATKDDELIERMHYDYGLPDGCFASYERDRVKENSWYDQGLDVMEMFSQTSESVADDFYSDVYGFLGEIIRIQGKVATIIEDEGIWILLEDKNKKIVPISITDYDEEGKSRTLSCALETDDQVEVLGRLKTRKTPVSYANMMWADELYVDAILIISRGEEEDAVPIAMSDGKSTEGENLFKLWDLERQITGVVENVRFDFDKQVYMYDVVSSEDRYQITGNITEGGDVSADGKNVEIDVVRTGIKYYVDDEGSMKAVSVWKLFSLNMIAYKN